MRSVLLLLSALLVASSAHAAYDRCGSLSAADLESRRKQNRHSRWEWEQVHQQVRDGVLTLAGTGRLDALGASVEIYAPEGADATVSALLSLLGPIDHHLEETKSSLPHDDSSASYNPPPTLKILVGDFDSALAQAIADCPYDGECAFVIYRSFWGRVSAEELQFTAAHEIYHIAQMLIWPEVYQCKSFWWVEGTAEWFANRVMPGKTYPQGFLRHFDRHSNDSSLLGIHYGAVAFWFWAGEEYGHWFPMHLGVWGNDGLDDEKTVGETLPPAAWHDFLETYLSGRLRYPDGRLAIPEPYLGEVVDEPWLLEGPPMAFSRIQMRAEAGEWQLRLQSQGASLVSFQEEDASWTRLNVGPRGSDGLTYRVECPPEPRVQAAISLNGEPLKVRTTIVDGTPDEDCRCLKPIPRDHCMIGVWRAESTDLPDRMNSVPMSPTRWTGQDMGVNTFTFNADGTYHQLTEREPVSDFEASSGGVTMQQRVKVKMEAAGRWSVVDELELEICKESFHGEMMITMRMGGREQTTGPHPIPEDPETTGAWRHEYVCGGDQADVTLIVGDQRLASWTARRVSR